jgi:hypothetical protein
MKSSFESAKHQAILEQRLQDQDAARLGKITGDKAVHVLTNELTLGERLARRKKAQKAHPEAF